MSPGADWPTCDYCSERFPDSSAKQAHIQAKHEAYVRELERMQEELYFSPPTFGPLQHADAVALSDAALAFAEEKRGDAEDAETVARARDRLEELVRREFPAAVLYVFGSNATGLPEKGSDVDMAADVSGRGHWLDPEGQRDAVGVVYRFLNRQGFPRGLFKVEETRVPIVSFKPQSRTPLGGGGPDGALHSSTWDLSFQHNGVRNSHWLRACLHDCGALRVAALWLKAWSKEADINDGRHGKLTSYAFLVLLIYYAVATGRVQYRDPALYSTSDADPCPAYLGLAGEDVAEGHVGAIIAGFFDYYCSFDFSKHVVSLNRDPVKGFVHKGDLGWLHDKPGSRKEAVYYHICIEDPYEELLPLGEGLNLGRKLTEYKACKLRLAFRAAAQDVREQRAREMVRGTGAPGPDHSNEVCRSCGEVGHISKNCPQRHANDQCFLCGQVGHIRADCPTKQTRQACYRCGAFSHLARDCPEGYATGKGSSSKGYAGKGLSKGGYADGYGKGSSSKGGYSKGVGGTSRTDRGKGVQSYDPDYDRGKGMKGSSRRSW